jgi:ubiquitin carboxyl-terminal hydrolase 3
MSSGSSSSVSPHAFLSTVWKVLPTFKGYRQQDAQEFMRCLLDRMDYELQQRAKQQKSVSPNPGPFLPKPHPDKSDEETESEVGRIFGGLLQNEITCLRCGHISRKDDLFLDLSLDIPEPKMNGTITLADCLGSFMDIEMLEETEKYQCEKCSSLQRISKKFTIKKAPEVRLLVLFFFCHGYMVKPYLLYIIHIHFFYRSCVYI